MSWETLLKSQFPSLIKSLILPGVATTQSTPFFKSLICGYFGTPPYTTSDFRLTNAPNSSITTCDCIANSLVGASTSIRGVRRLLPATYSFARALSAGMEKAKVFPLPVSAILLFKSIHVGEKVSRHAINENDTVFRQKTYPTTSLRFPSLPGWSNTGQHWDWIALGVVNLLTTVHCFKNAS